MKYRELTTIALRLQQAFIKIKNLLEREHDFLRHASHELRTPIAVNQNNVELIERRTAPEPLQEPVLRIQRSAHSMHNLTETLLWLSRDDKRPINEVLVNLSELVNEQVELHRYLLKGKAVKLNIQHEKREPSLRPITPLKIIIANLLRNAFQYTQVGQVEITISNHEICIVNQEYFGKDAQKPSLTKTMSYTDTLEDSHRIGLALCQQICEALGWKLLIQTEQGYFSVRLLIST